MNKILLITVFTLTSLNFYSQSNKDELLEKDIAGIVEEIKFMYHYDQATREYLHFQTFDKNITDSIESLSKEMRDNRSNFTPVNSDSLKNKIWNTYINPMDQIHTERMIEITQKYGFPSAQRLKKFSKDSIDFNPLILLIHSPSRFSKELIEIAKYEKSKDRIKKCDFGYLLWHLKGRSDFQPMLDNGYEMAKNEDGTFSLKAVDCE
ncbi:hypothetical protein [Salegentibacter sp. Hel_I_6]|uniref:hypothetical protein n=1 Tax=Salegentibacter sp. Hel_I_6 TaxID=1250278 RepID=UPI00055DF154|nr:hypothetical protein [Salegentibacter sp. Hel_I_6]